MRIVCDKCGAEHALEPPDWVVSSGRAFRFRCASCGHTQMVPPPTNISLPQDALPSAPPGRTAVPPPQRESAEPPLPREKPATQLYLKQDGKVYLIREWGTLERWIAESRIGPEDLVSEGGVRWEPLQTRPELAHLFARQDSEKTPIDVTPPPITVPTPFPFGGETPFGTPEPQPRGRSGLATTLEIEGIGLGLPPLPSLGEVRTGATASDASAAPGEVASEPDDDSTDVTAPVDAAAQTVDNPATMRHLFGDLATAPPTNTDFGDEWAQPAPRLLPYVVVGAVVLVILAVIAVLFWPAPPPAPEGPAIGSVIPDVPVPLASDPEPVAEPEPEPAPEPEPEPVAEPAPAAPEPVPAPLPAPVALPLPATAPEAALPTSASLTEQGWARLEKGDASGAASLFERAVSRSPGDAEAAFAYGYVLARHLGRPADAVPHLCRAAGVSGTTGREAQAILTEEGLACP